MSLYGSLQGPAIPDSVDKINLPLGKQRLKIVKIVKEGPSKDKQSINVNFLIASPTAGVKGTAFFRFNFRHVPFKIGGDQFGSYLHTNFPTDGLAAIEKIANSGNQFAAQAKSELFRARIALSTLKKLNVWSGVGNVLGFDSTKWVGVEFDGSITYADKTKKTLRQDKDGKLTCYDKAKKEEVPVKLFDETQATAEVSSVYAQPKPGDPTTEDETEIVTEHATEEADVATETPTAV